MINPILERELKTRVRSWKTALLISGYLLLIGSVVALTFLVQSETYNYNSYGFDPSVVTTIFVVIALFQLGVLVTILPVFTATSISGERERQTLDLLMCTDISPWKIIFGKMSAALSFVMLLILSAMPFIGVTFLFGGVTVLDIFKIVLYYLATAIMVSSIGMFCTVHFKKNITSIIVSYVLLGVVVVLPFILLVSISVIVENMGPTSELYIFLEKNSYEVVTVMMASNPFFGMLSILVSSTFGGNLFYLFNMNVKTSSFFRYIEPWMACLIFYTAFTSLMLFFTKRRLVKIK